MIVGVVTYSISTGMLASILVSVDAKTGVYESKVTMLDHMRTDYFIPLDLF
jgi:hypothetical protein